MPFDVCKRASFCYNPLQCRRYCFHDALRPQAKGVTVDCHIHVHCVAIVKFERTIHCPHTRCLNPFDHVRCPRFCQTLAA